MKSRTLILLATLAACSTPSAAGTGDDTPRKVFVCKYVGTPGIDERLQTGQNPISVSVNAIPLDDVQVGSEFADAQGRSLVIAFDTGQPEPSPDACPQPSGPTTTTHHATTTTAKATTTTTQPHHTTTSPTTTVVINTVVITGPSTTTTTGAPTSTTTSTSAAPTTTASSPPSSTTTTTTSIPPTSTSSSPPPVISSPTTTTTTTTTTLPPPTTAPPPPTPFTFGAATTVCIAEVPTIRINFQNTFPELAGRTGTLTMSDINGNVVSSQPLTYQPNTTVDLLYPGTRVNPDGTIDDVPGWTLTDAGLWIRDPTDAYLRDGIQLTYTVNPTATAFITYPPESSTCANPENPPAPRLPPTR